MIVRLLAVIAAMCFASVAEAQNVWSTPASACTPSDATIKFDRHLVGVASVRHATGNVDPIVLVCPIAVFTDNVTTSWNLRLVYQDSTGTSTAALVRALLYRMAIGSATPVLLTAATSNSSMVTGLNTVSSPELTHMFDFDANIYWVRVDLDRSSTSQTVIVHSVVLTGTGAISDIRAKHDIVLLGRLDNGLGFYRFSYNGGDKAYVGVMAQEVQAIMPDAVVRGSDGYLRVYYDRLGLRMQTWEDWVASGEKIPATAPSIRQ